ncbi:MAG: ATP-binding protein [Bacteroidetes bacterium]|nr:ATP-binding protein [Bacteroidota bacterium]
MEKNLEDKIKELEREILLLKIELQNTRLREIEKEKNLNSYVRDLDKAKELNLNSVFREQELKNLATSWERIVDELAHSINTDVFVAVSAMSKFLDNPKIKKANYHTRQIRDLTNLLLLYLKRNEIDYSNEFADIDIKEVIQKQVDLIKDGISTLRISSDEHEESLLKMEIPVTVSGETKIAVMEEFADAIPLLIKDLVRNAMKHTTEENPKVEVKIEEFESFVELTIFNNGAISEKLADWFNKSSLEDPENMSKSSKVGLRVVKKWVDLLKIDTRYLRDEKNDTTTVRLQFPKRISYEKN